MFFSIGNAGSLPLPLSGAVFLAFALFPRFSLADPCDWVNPVYVNSHPTKGDTTAARQSIASGAALTAKNGPWVVGTPGILPPSQDPRDYLSWAPYHWPDCNWCPKGKRGTESDELAVVTQSAATRRLCRRRVVPSRHLDVKQYRDVAQVVQALPTDDLPTESNPVLPTPAPSLPSNPGAPSSSTNTDEYITQEPQGNNAAVKPTKTKAKPTPRPSCTPSPTKSLAPSATWTTCAYKARDGQVNPDVRQLKSVGSLNSMSQSVILNAIGSVLENDRALSRNVVRFINKFFLDPRTGMNPNMDFGQIVRGPGKQVGSYMGVLDMRVMAKVINAVEVLRVSDSPDWVSDLDAKFVDWARTYLQWLESGALGKKAGRSANNHASFYYNQIGALKLLLKDIDGARASLQSYFDNQFQSQLAGSGEQPLEAVRSRPFHYRCFNLEAMIVNAKLGDQLGTSFWNKQSKYAATIQTATDYLMNVDPGDENPNELLPHVAAVAAAYGDPDGKYARFLQQYQYKNKPFWFYDQTAALPNSPAAQSRSKREDSDHSQDADGSNQMDAPDIDPEPSEELPSPGSSEPEDPTPTHPSGVDVMYPRRPAIFANTNRVELEEGLYATWSQVKHYYDV